MMWVAIDCGPHVRRVHGQLEAWMLLGLRCKFEAFSEDSQELVETSWRHFCCLYLFVAIAWGIFFPRSNSVFSSSGYRTPDFTLHTPHFTLYTLHFTLHSPHFKRYTLHSIDYTLLSTLHTPHATLFTLHSTLYISHSTLYTPHSTLYTVYSTLYTLHFTHHTLHYIYIYLYIHSTL